MFDSVGIAKSSGVATALIMGCSFFPTVYLQWQGNRLYKNDLDRA